VHPKRCIWRRRILRVGVYMDRAARATDVTSAHEAVHLEAKDAPRRSLHG